VFIKESIGNRQNFNGQKQKTGKIYMNYVLYNCHWKWALTEKSSPLVPKTFTHLTYNTQQYSINYKLWRCKLSSPTFIPHPISGGTGGGAGMNSIPYSLCLVWAHNVPLYEIMTMSKLAKKNHRRKTFPSLQNFFSWDKALHLHRIFNLI
jgi:hypothetical protein